MIVTKFVPREKFNRFHEILCVTGGRYVSNPTSSENFVMVCFEPGDMNKLNNLWEQANTHIVEVRKDQWWRKLLRRFGFNV